MAWLEISGMAPRTDEQTGGWTNGPMNGQMGGLVGGQVGGQMKEQIFGGVRCQVSISDDRIGGISACVNLVYTHVHAHR